MGSLVSDSSAAGGTARGALAHLGQAAGLRGQPVTVGVEHQAQQLVHPVRQVGMQAVKSEYASLALAIDTGYRLEAYAEDGIAGTGPVLRGNLEWRQALGERTRLSQVTRIETGQRGTYLRNSLQLDIALQPALSLVSGIELRRDSALTGRNQTDANLKLRYVF